MAFGPVLSVAGSARLITVPDQAGEPISVVLKDIFHSIIDDDFADHVWQSNGQLDDSFKGCYDE